VLVLLIVGGLVALLCVGGIVAAATSPDTSNRGSRSTTAPTGGPTAAADAPKSKTAQLGQTIEFIGALGGQVVNYTLVADKTYTTSPKYNQKPEKGLYYVVNATIEAKKGSAYASVYDFAFIAADGSVFEATLALGFDNVLTAAQLNEGQKTAGLVVFDVPQAALAGAKIELRADFFSSGDAGYWQLP
jgi:hypothetical protein